MSVTTKLLAGALAGSFALFGGLAIAGADSSTGKFTPATSLDADEHPTSTVVQHDSAETDTHQATTSAAITASPHVQTTTACTTNHGAMVSAVAHQQFSSGRAHGAAVSAAAHQKCTNKP